ncbi:hypothetical protein BgiMline_001815 [Biomphalaria glabrata]
MKLESQTLHMIHQMDQRKCNILMDLVVESPPFTLRKSIAIVKSELFDEEVYITYESECFCDLEVYITYDVNVSVYITYESECFCEVEVYITYESECFCEVEDYITNESECFCDLEVYITYDVNVSVT